jgi:phosphoribosylamine---glycine ligase
MQVLVIGGGGREHALAWKISKSPLVTRVFCAPGNAGIASVAECVPIKADNIEALVEFAAANQIELTVVGPEAPLIAGIVDRFEAAGLPVFGPSHDPARLEGSKVFAKSLMESAGIPTADFWICSTAHEAEQTVRSYYNNADPGTKLVIKADGIAAGKGVIVASGEAQALAAVRRIMTDRVFGTSGNQIVIEECLVGEEASIMAITDGTHIIPMVPSQDHKRAFDGDQGPNTGGMGAYTPVPVVPSEIVSETIEKIIRPAVLAIRELGIPYRGVIYAGIMVTDEGPMCIEFNCRFGDPETQVILPMMESDIVPIFKAVADGTLENEDITWKQGAAVAVVAASEGYPDAFDPGMDTTPLLGRRIFGLDRLDPEDDNCVVFHSGTRFQDGAIVTSGGRVLVVTGVAADLHAAREIAYAGIDQIQFEGIHYRRDIGSRSLGERN